MNEKFLKAKQEYQEIKVPKEGCEMMLKSIQRAKRQNRMFKFKVIGGCVVAAVLALVILPNTSQSVAYAMQKIPVIGNLIEVVTFRDYSYQSERFEADVKVPEVVVDDPTTDTVKDSVAAINESVEDMTNELLDQFHEQVDSDESYAGLYIDPSVVTNTDTWFTLRVDVCQSAGSGSEAVYFYHIDKTTGNIATIADLFKSGVDYAAPISENIIQQMEDQMAADDSLTYFVGEEDENGWNFTSIDENAKFYLNESGELVICFDKYEVAPGYMGTREFTIPESVYSDLLK